MSNKDELERQLEWIESHIRDWQKDADEIKTQIQSINDDEFEVRTGFRPGWIFPLTQEMRQELEGRHWNQYQLDNWKVGVMVQIARDPVYTSPDVLYIKLAQWGTGTTFKIELVRRALAQVNT